MRHIDDDQLALIALEAAPPEAEAADHLDSCDTCRQELAELRRVVAAGRAPDATAPLSQPPPHVWDTIAAAVGHTGESRDLAVEVESPSQRTATSPPSTRGRIPSWVGVAAGIAIGVGVAGTVTYLNDSDEPSGPAATVVATAELSAFGDTGSPGSAEVVESDGDRSLDVRIDSRTPGPGYREVWLLDPDTGSLVSLGALRGTTATLGIPSGLDLADFPVVDVSREQFDGDPSHSTDTISRGELDL